MNLDAQVTGQVFTLLLEGLILALAGVIVWVFNSGRQDMREYAAAAKLEMKELTASVNALNVKFAEILTVMHAYEARIQKLEQGENNGRPKSGSKNQRYRGSSQRSL